VTCLLLLKVKTKKQDHCVNEDLAPPLEKRQKETKLSKFRITLNKKPLDNVLRDLAPIGQMRRVPNLEHALVSKRQMRMEINLEHAQPCVAQASLSMTMPRQSNPRNPNNVRSPLAK